MLSQFSFVQMAAILSHAKLCPEGDCRQIKYNNFEFDAEVIDTAYPVIVDILRDHYIHQCLSMNASVPTIYLQQFWHTLQFESTRRSDTFQGRIEDIEVSFSLHTFRRILGLPSSNDSRIGGHFGDFPTEDQLCEDVIQLGLCSNAAQSHCLQKDVSSLMVGYSIFNPKQIYNWKSYWC